MHQYVKIGLIAVVAVIAVRTFAGFVPLIGPIGIPPRFAAASLKLDVGRALQRRGGVVPVQVSVTKS